MKNLLKATIKKTQQCSSPNRYHADVNITNSLNAEDVVDELIKDGLVENREWALKLLQNFNEKAANLMCNGNEIDTGLVKMNPKVTPLIFKNNWHPNSYNIGVTFSKGAVLSNAISNTAIEMTIDAEKLDDENETNSEEITDLSTESSYVPPCGHAFRNWIFQS